MPGSGYAAVNEKNWPPSTAIVKSFKASPGGSPERDPWDKENKDPPPSGGRRPCCRRGPSQAVGGRGAHGLCGLEAHATRDSTDGPRGDGFVCPSPRAGPVPAFLRPGWGGRVALPTPECRHWHPGGTVAAGTVRRAVWPALTLCEGGVTFECPFCAVAPREWPQAAQLFRGVVTNVHFTHVPCARPCAGHLAGPELTPSP